QLRRGRRPDAAFEPFRGILRAFEGGDLGRAPGHRDRRRGGVERVLARRGDLDDVAILLRRAAREEESTRDLVRLPRAAGHPARVDLERERQARRIEGPDRETGGGELEQLRHAADRAGADRARAADLEDRLRADAADREALAL